MSIQSLIDQIAELSPPTPDHDLPSLVQLHDLLADLVECEELTDQAVADHAAEAVDAIHRVVLRETEQTEAELQRASELIEQLQQELGAAAGTETGPAPQSGSPPTPPDAAGDDTKLADALERINGKLLALDPADTGEVEELDAELADLLADAAETPDVVREGIEAAQDSLRSATTDDPETAAATLENVATLLALACQHLHELDESRLAEEAEPSADASAADSVADDAPPADAEPQNEAPAATDEPDTLDTEAPEPEGNPAPETPAEPEPKSEAEQEAGTPAAPAAAEPDPSATEASQPTPAAPVEPPRLPTETDGDLLREFAVECLDHIAAAEASLLELETRPDDSEQVNVIFRAFHTIKGTSGFLGLDCIQSLAHLAENLLDRARNGELRVIGGYADLSLNACDALKTMITGIEEVEPGGLLPMPVDYAELMELLRDPEAAGVSEDADTQPLRTGDVLVARGAVERDQIEQTAGKQGSKPLGQILVEEGAISAAQAVDAVRTQRSSSGAAPQARTPEASVRVGTDRLDRLIDAVGELVIAQSMVTQDPAVTHGASPQLSRNVAHAGKIVRELQEVSMSLRMVPLKATFGKMARLSRDLARKAGKKVRFVTEGEETEIDRNLVETLNDPLVHMMRNAADHGIETPEVREAAGKDPTGTVRLRAYHSAGNVVLELSDDGKGIDREKIIAKAVDRGLVQSGENLSDGEAFGLIFKAGLSTAEKITDVSGRGVGMDVVKTSIESLRGRIEVDSEVGKGTTITIRLPLTMAIADAMLLRVAEQRYLLPIVSIERSFRPEPGQISSVVGRGELVNVRGELLPVLRVYKQFRIAGAATDPHEALLIIIEGEGRRCALMVDELMGQHQVVVKSLGPSLGQVPGVAGGAILGDGRVGLILDAAGLMELSQQRDDADEVAEIQTLTQEQETQTA